MPWYVRMCWWYSHLYTLTHCRGHPDGAICPGGQQKPYPQDGYHQALRASDKFLKCFVPSACPSMPSGECAAGFTGSRCSECSPGLYKKGTECTTCTGTSLMLPVLAAVLGTLAVCGVGIWMAIADLNYCTVNVAVQFFQVAGLILSIDMGWPDLLRPITHTVKSFNVDLVALNFNCAFQIDFNDWMTIALFVPAVFAVVILTTCLAWALVFHGKSAIAKALWTSYKAFLAVCLIGHIPLSKQFVTVFECATDVDRSYMISDPQVSCYTSQWYGGKSKAIAGCVLFACGIPFWVLVISLRNRKKLDDPAVVHRYGILFDLYVDGCWYFTFYRTINHLLLMAVPVLFADWPIVIFLFALFLVNVDRVLVERRNPYRFPHCNNIHSHTAWAFTFLIIAGIAFYSRLLSEIHQNVLGGIVFAFMVAVTLLLAHAFLYEAQLMYYPWLRTFGLTGRIARSRAYKALFPRHLTSIGQAEVRQCKRLPALHSKPKAEYYPQGAFESPEDHLNKKTNGVRGPNTGELEIVRSSYVLEAKGSMFKGDGEAD
ncbi:hypothetical protein BC832DRAFT_76421 [Gaertneriomyces semiglobifer]|nr:hypothetical protein BC832DRAFT_76421 [Gaertneriomyces semiglobifer]